MSIAIMQSWSSLHLVKKESKAESLFAKSAPQSNLKLTSSSELKMFDIGFAANLQVNKYPHAKPVKVISFGRAEGKSQNRGLMMHISHLPASRSHIGQFLDPETERFTQFLHDSKQTHWIMNPLTPIGDTLCPYNSPSRFDRNKYIVNLNVLTKPEYGSILKSSDLPEETYSRKFTLKMLQEQKDPVFKTAFNNFKQLDKTHPLKVEFNNFCKEEGPKWLDNNAIHRGISSMVTSNGLGNGDWRSWPEALMMFPENIKGQSFERKMDALNKIDIEGKKIGRKDIEKIEQFRFEQFLFDKQFKDFKKDLDKKGITLFVDMAYAIDPGGNDVWANKDIVCLDKENSYEPKKLTGCMPEPAYPYTQIWGQAVWNLDSPQYWEYQENSMRKILQEGCVRLDHFGGLINRGAIPARIEGKDGNMYPIYEAMENHIELAEPYYDFDGKEKTHADKDIWRDEWLEDVSKKTNDKGETLVDMYIRVAEESGLNPKSAFIVEDLGGVCTTPTFLETMEKYSDKLSGLRLPIAYGVESTIGRERSMHGKPHDPWGKEVRHPENIALLSGSHDPPTMMQTIETTMSNAKRNKRGNIISPEALEAKGDRNLRDSSYHMVKLAREAGVTPEEMKEKKEGSYYNISQKLLNGMYKLPAKHMQTTISDALGIYFRPNIPGFWNGNSREELVEKAGVIDMDRISRPQEKANIVWNMKPNTETFGFWSMRFPKNFLDKSREEGGYKERANNYVKMMQNLFPDKKAATAKNQ